VQKLNQVGLNLNQMAAEVSENSTHMSAQWLNQVQACIRTSAIAWEEQLNKFGRLGG